MLLGARQFFERRAAPTPALPYDARVLYVETDGLGSYIDTGVIPTYQSDIHVSFQVIHVPYSGTTSFYNPIFGARLSNAAVGIRFQVGVRANVNQLMFYFPGLSSGTATPSYDNNIHDIIDSGVGGSYYDGSQIATVQLTSSMICSNFCLGSGGLDSLRPSANIQYYYTQSRFYSCRIYTDGVLVFDGIPVRKNGRGYIYDRVSGRLCGNAGASGTSVTYGPDVPFDEYVEYLESTGTQYVGTGIVAQDNLHAVVRFRATGQLTGRTNDFPFFATNGRYGFGFYSLYSARFSESAFWSPNLNESYSVGSAGIIHSDDNWHVCELDSTSGAKFAKLDGTEIYNTDTTRVTTGSGLYLFARTSSTIGQGKISMFSVKNTSTGTEMVNFAPVRVGQTGYMYDRANPTGGSLGNGLYPNLGTGNFVFGADI